MNQKLLSVAKGETPADLVIRNGKVVNVYSGEIYDGGVAICGDTIAAVGDVEYCIGEGTRVVDAEGKYLTPGFLDGHIHPESSSLAIRPFAEAVLAPSTTCSPSFTTRPCPSNRALKAAFLPHQQMVLTSSSLSAIASR